MVSLRSAHPEDLDDLAWIKREALCKKGFSAKGMGKRSLPNITLDRHRDAETTVMVAEHDGSIIGWGYLHIEPEPIALVFTHPSVAPSKTGDVIVDRFETIVESEGRGTLRVHLY